MSFGNLGALGFLAGLAAIAGLLFLLQRLRVRFSEREVVTTLFWKQAVEETRARMLMRRFRHPWSYLLALLICGLVWLAFAAPKWNRDSETDHVFLLDGSAGMAWGDRFARARDLLVEEADRLPADRRRVFFCGADAHLVLDRGEETSLLGPRLAALAPEACPATVEREALAIAQDETTTASLRILVVGDAAVSAQAVAMLPARAVVARLRRDNAAPPDGNTGIVALGVANAASGTFDRVDVRIETTGPVDAGLTMTLDGQALAQAPTSEAGAFHLRDLPARGGLLEIATAGSDPLPVDNRARIILPDRRTVAVAIDPALDQLFLDLVAADPALVPATGSAQVAIGGAAAGGLPAIELVTGDGITVVHEEELASNDLDEIRARLAATGLDRVGRKLAPDPEVPGGFALVPRYLPGPARKVQLGVDLIGPGYDFTQTTAFPLFMAAAIRWLAGVESIEPFAVAGERSVHPGRFALAGSDYAPPRAGPCPDRSGTTAEISLAAVGGAQADALNPVTRSSTGSRWPGIFSWCILAALLLVGGEWWLFQKGRLP